MTGWEQGGLARALGVLIAVLAATSGPVVAGPAMTGGDDRATQTGRPAFAEPSPDSLPGANNTTYHANPRRVTADSNLSDVERYLQREMTGRLLRSINVSRANRERARNLIDNDSEYQRLAERYDAVANETGADPRSAGQFGDVGAVQQEFFGAVERYRRTHDDYRRAYRNNETTRARILAHRLERRANAVNRTAVRLNRSYGNLSTDRFDTANASRTVGGIRADVARTQRAVRDRTLVRTTLTVRAIGPGGSFRDPVTLAGRLRTENGTPVADEPVAVDLGNRTVRARTDGDGSFRVRYRPTTVRTGTRLRTVRYRPANASAYAGSEATVRFGVRQVTPEVTLSERPTALSYNETFSTNGTVGVDGVGAPDVPVVLTVGGVRVGRAETGPNGSFGVSARLPSNVSTGPTRLRARVPLSGRALAPATESANVTVEPTPTAVSIANATGYEETVYVAGRLGVDGDPLAGRTLTVRVDGRPVGTATTNRSGEYGVTATVPSNAVDGADSVRVTVAYPATGENLAPARTNATVRLATADTRRLDDRLLPWVAGLVGVGVLGALAVRRARSRGWRFTTGSGDDRAGPSADDGRSDGMAATLFDAAAARLVAGEFDFAATAAYASVRSRLEPAVDADGSLTHWEFYVAARGSDLPSAAVGRLERLTKVYERAAFSDDATDRDDAVEAVAIATTFGPRSDDAPGEESREDGDGGGAS